jgi:hypothetical protein
MRGLRVMTGLEGEENVNGEAEERRTRWGSRAGPLTSALRFLRVKRRGRSKPGTYTTAKAKARVKNAGWQPFAMFRINLRYDGKTATETACSRPELKCGRPNRIL